MSIEECFWDQEDFEEHVARGIIALHETQIGKMSRKLIPEARVTKGEWKKIRKRGLYFPGRGREMLPENCVMPHVDGLVQFATIAFTPSSDNANDSTSIPSYLQIVNLELCDSIPKTLKLNPFERVKIKDPIYAITNIVAKPTGGVETFRWYLRLNKDHGFQMLEHYEYEFNDMTQRVSRRTSKWRLEGDRQIWREDVKPPEHTIETFQHPGIFGANAVYWFYTDRKYLWNVKAIEKDARVTFGVSPREVKSLFYARDLPMTKTGRKRPILHWVRAHQRRMKGGVDIEIKRHLRGIFDFEMGGTQFRITRPVRCSEQQIEQDEEEIFSKADDMIYQPTEHFSDKELR